MEVEIVKKNTTAQPLQNEIQEAFSEKYDIEAQHGVCSNKGSFEIIKMLIGFPPQSENFYI